MNAQKPIEKTLKKEIYDYIEASLKKENSDSYLISILHKVQGEYGYLSDQHMQEVAETLGVPAAKVSGVATFYHFFRLKPQGKYSISVCMGTACYVKGADKILMEFEKELGIKQGETTKDGLFTIEQTRCVGVCGLAPVVMINEKTHGSLTVEEIPGLIKAILDIESGKIK